MDKWFSLFCRKLSEQVEKSKEKVVSNTEVATENFKSISEAFGKLSTIRVYYTDKEILWKPEPVTINSLLSED